MLAEDVARELKNIHAAMTEIQADIRDIKSWIADRESDPRFETVTTELREQTGILKSVLVHVRRRVEGAEVRKTRW